VHLEVGACEGTIRRERSGKGGFGYDPLFQPRGYTITMAELDAVEKNRISHRGIASLKMKAFLASYLPTRAVAT
jgi:XTP/dITP diphosphohydrolase